MLDLILFQGNAKQEINIIHKFKNKLSNLWHVSTLKISKLYNSDVLDQ